MFTDLNKYALYEDLLKQRIVGLEDREVFMFSNCIK
jgi:hypothetical protein